MDELIQEMQEAVQALAAGVWDHASVGRVKNAWEAIEARAATPDRPLSLGERPHDPANCYMHQGQPHLGPCLDAEGYTRWYWMEGPGSQPLSSTQIAMATQRLVAEAFAARAQRTDWPTVARKLMTAEGARETLDDVLPDVNERARQRGLGPDA